MRTEDRVRRFAREMHPVLRPSMADRVIFPVTVGLVKEVNLAVEHKCAGSAKAIRFAWVLWLHRGHFFPMNQILAGRDADAPTLKPLTSRHGVIEKIAPAKFHHSGILRVGDSTLGCIPEHHHPACRVAGKIHSLEGKISR